MQAMQAAISQLNNAKSAFANSTEPWGGRPAKAGPLIDQALSELKKALDFAASKNTQ